MLVKYIRNEHGHPTGVVVATGKDQLGYSLCHPRDTFDKQKALLIAQRRADGGARHVPFEEEGPRAATLRKHLHEMRERAARYFK